MRTLHFLGALAIGALDGAARVAIPGFYRATGSDRSEADVADLHEELGSLERKCAGLRQRAEKAEAKDAKGVKALADALKGIDRLTAEAKSTAKELASRAEAAEQLRAEAARMRLARDAEAQRANAAQDRIKALGGDAVPACYGMFDANGIVDVVDKRNGPGAFCKVPLYRHPPKPVDVHEPVGWVRFDRRGDVEAFCVAWQLGYEPVYRSSVNQAAHPLSLVESLRALAAKAEAGGFTIQPTSIRKLVG